MSLQLDTAVILAGGLGTRTRPLTDTLAKPMIPVGGAPFLERLISQLKPQGIKRFILLLGYLPETVTSYFQDGARWGVRIEYSISPVENDTGLRIHLARPMIPETFLLLYCDNYCPLNLAAMKEQFERTGADAQIAVYANEDNYTRSNALLDKDGWVVTYDKSRSAPGLHCVDIGYAIIKHRCLDLLTGANENFEKVVYTELVKRRQLGAFLTHHRYYSIGSLERVKQAEAFLAQPKTIILDRDGVLNEKAPRGEYVVNWKQFRWLPGAKEAIAALRSAGYRVIVVTNQAGIARKALTWDDLNDIHRQMTREVEEAGGKIEKIYCCPHHWDDGCFCRKPKPGMFFQAQHDFDLDLARVAMFGDDERDKQATEAAGCQWGGMVSSTMPLLDHVRKILGK